MALLGQGITLRLSGQPAAALERVSDALRLMPELLPATALRCELLGELGHHDEALVELDDALLRTSAAAPLRQLRARLLQQALDASPGASALASGAQRLRHALLLLQAGDHQAALQCLQVVLALEPDHIAALNNAGNALLALDRPEESLQCYEAVLRQDSDNAMALFNAANVLQKFGDFDVARARYLRVQQLRPEFAEVRVELAHCALMQQDWAQGWKLFEARWQTRWLRDQRPPSSAQAWQGQDLAGKTLLLWAEQGLGDTLQFVRFARCVRARGAHVLLRVPSSLQRLLRSLDAGIDVLTGDAPPPHHDLHCPLMSLPHWLGLRDARDFGSAAYLVADAHDVQAWRARLGPRHRPRIGLAWAGRQNGQINPGRDVPLHTLGALFAQVPEVEWISLQHEIPAGDAATYDQQPLRKPAAAGFADFADSAALIATLDLVLCVDSAVAHLAGALGRPCWIMLRASSEWRWQRERSDSPWYGATRLFRQRRAGDWDSVVDQLRVALAERFSG